MAKLIQLATRGGKVIEPPKELKRPCDYGLESAWIALETQLGTIEGYNRLVRFAERINKRIFDGKAKAQNPLYSIDALGSRMPDKVVAHPKAPTNGRTENER